jgi:hypothetical protein
VLSIYEVVGRVNRKKDRHLLSVGRAVKGARGAFILTLDGPPDLLTIERGNEAKRSSVELRSLPERFCSRLRCCTKGLDQRLAA